MAQSRSILNRVPLAPVIAVMFGVAVATLVAATPQWMFEGTIGSSGIGRLLSVAQPPLGIKARMLAILVTFSIVALFVWFAVRAVERLIEGPLGDHNDDADLELDLAAYAATLPKLNMSRGPIFADRELGAPLMSDEALATAAPLPMVAEPAFTSIPVNFAPEPLSPPEPVDEWAEPEIVREAVVRTVAEPVSAHGKPNSVHIKLAPLATMIFECSGSGSVKKRITKKTNTKTNETSI